MRVARARKRDARLLVRPSCSVAVTLFVAGRGSPIDRAPICCSVWLGPRLEFGAVPLGVPALLAFEAVDVVVRRCRGLHGGATPGYTSLRPFPRQLVEKHVSHSGLHLVDVEERVAVNNHLHILVLVDKAREADVLEPPVGYLLSHLLDSDTKKTLLVESSGFCPSSIGVFTSPSMVARMTSWDDLVVVAPELLKAACPSQLTSFSST